MSNRDKSIERAQQHADRGRFDLAAAEYKRLVALHPDDLRLRAKLGFCQARGGALAEAVQTWLETAHGYEQRGVYGDAAVMLQQVLQLAPSHVDAYLWLAQLMARLGKRAESRQSLEAAHRLLEEAGRMFEALNVLESIVGLDPDNVALCIRLGEAYAAQGRPAEAVQVLTRAANVLRQAEWMDDFIRVAERLVWLDPTNYELGRELAVYYLRQRDPQSALQRLKRCYEADRSDPDTLKLLADTFIDLREPEKAATILRVLADVFEQRDELEHADAVRDQAFRLDPEFSSFEAERGGATGLLGEPTDPQGRYPDPSDFEVEEGDWTWVPPAATDKDLSPLEMSLQAEGPGADAPRRFLPAITAEGRHGRVATDPRYRTVTTQELDLSDLVFLEQHRVANTDVTEQLPAASRRVLATTELDLSDLEEIRPESGRSASASRRAPLTTQERDMNELEVLAGDLSERFVRATRAELESSREKETARLRRKPGPDRETLEEDEPTQTTQRTPPRRRR